MSQHTIFEDAQKHMLDRYNVSAQSRFVKVPCIGGRAHLLICGDGPSIVMINGIGTPGAMWAPLMAELGSFRLYVIDLPAYGLTDPFPHIANELRHNAVEFLDQTLDAIELDRPAVIANSLGSLWASWLALDSNRVAALVHIGCPAVVLDTSAPFPMRLMSVRTLGRLITRLQPPSPKQVEQLSKMVKEYPLIPELINLLVATQQLPGYRSTFLDTLHTLLRLRGNRPAHSLHASQLEQISQPTLLVWGRSDPFGSPHVARRIAAIMPNAELQMVDGGHAPWLKQAEVVGRIVGEFLQRTI